MTQLAPGEYDFNAMTDAELRQFKNLCYHEQRRYRALMLEANEALERKRRAADEKWKRAVAIARTNAPDDEEFSRFAQEICDEWTDEQIVDAETRIEQFNKLSRDEQREHLSEMKSVYVISPGARADAVAPPPGK